MRSILVIKPSSLGDIVHTIPAVAAVRDTYPKAQITWVINPEWAPLLRGNPDVNHVHIFPRGDFRGLGGPANLAGWWRQTRTLRPDLALDFQGLLRSAFIAKASGARKIIGLNDAREGAGFFYHRRARVSRKMHAVERYMRLAAEAGAQDQQELRCPLPTGDRLPRFDEFPPFILLHPFARGRRKSLSADVIEELCVAFRPTRVVVVGRGGFAFNAPANCIDLTNQTTLLQLVRLIRVAHFFITVDSGPAHIAAALTNNLLSIHRWTDPRRVGPYNAEAWIWKGGEFLRMGDLTAQTRFNKARHFLPSSVKNIVELVDRVAPRPQTALVEQP